MGQCCPKQDPEQCERNVGLAALGLGMVMVVFLAVSWATSPEVRHRHARRTLLSTPQEHEQLPVRRASLDRG